mmetsp:Transcript_37202/g.55446  ORF Transcript_37202/g.55446 Transcript_37202/m.55446 type:complete len:81 (+) Transcript_37202:1420-1662(+)
MWETGPLGGGTLRPNHGTFNCYLLIIACTKQRREEENKATLAWSRERDGWKREDTDDKNLNEVLTACAWSPQKSRNRARN